ncbi:LysM peptidoglycan-binding domain-containing protein [Arthrobacter sp. JSM 101049]|uniref:LysM peptidoglycan-binding domain-containing protein n=1 Tax=Arthrobacter sp. JSM 101049 TaxID=929097 RepID=UPI0035631A07
MAQIAIAAPVFVGAGRTGVPSASKRARGPEASPAPLQLTRRGRFILIGLPLMLAATAAIVLAGIFTAPVMASGAAETRPVEATTVSVMDGDTIWELAAEFAPERDRQQVVAEITEMNDLRGSVLVPGQEIFVPTGD